MTNEVKKHHVVGDSMSSANLAAGLNGLPAAGQVLQKSLTSAVLQTALSGPSSAPATAPPVPQAAPPTAKGK
jgi:hypothetical protein